MNWKLGTFILGSAVILVTYQNCGGNFQTAGEASSASSEALGSTGTTPPPVMGLTEDQIRRQACGQNFNAPSFDSLSPAEVTISSGLATDSGDTAQNSITRSTIATTMSIKNAATQTSNTCSVFTSMRGRCSIVVDASHPASFTHAVGLDGSSLLTSGMTDAQKRTLAGLSVSLNDCDNQFDVGATSRAFRITLNRNQDFARCVQGSFYVQIEAEHEVQGYPNIVRLRSQPRFLKVNLTDGCWNEARLKMSQDFPRNVMVGDAVAMDGSWAVVSAPMQNMGAVLNAGAVHIFNLSSGSWVYHSTLQISDALADENISAVAIKGGTLVLSSANRRDQGGVFIYKLAGNSWNLAQSITPQVNQTGQKFGQSLSFDGTHLAVGAPKVGNFAGSVYVYRYNSTSGIFDTTPEIALNETTDNAGFGSSVAVSAGLLAVGAPMAVGKEYLGKGFVKVYQVSGSDWNLVATKTPGTEVSNSMSLRYGASVALSGNQLIIGVPGHGLNGMSENTYIGAAVYFSNYSGAITRTYVGNEANGVYGTAVALNGTGIFVSGPFRSSRGGLVDFYSTSDVATLKYRLFATNRTDNNGFGWSLATSGNRVLVGARIKNDPNASSGAAYIFDIK